MSNDYVSKDTITLNLKITVEPHLGGRGVFVSSFCPHRGIDYQWNYPICNALCILNLSLLAALSEFRLGDFINMHL